jgi:hypothetical protein
VEIRPGKGGGELLFGLTEQELVRVLGPPDKRYCTDSEVLRLQYFALRLELAIEPNNGDRFGWVEVHNPEATLFGRRLIGASIASVLSFVSESLGEEPERDDYGSRETFFYPRNWVELSVEFGRVRSINCGVMYDEADQPRWPTTGPAPAEQGLNRQRGGP